MLFCLLRPKTRYLMDLQKEWNNNKIIVIHLLPFTICHNSSLSNSGGVNKTFNLE